MCSFKIWKDSIISKDIKYHILRSLTLVILELLPQTLDSFRVCHIFLSYFLIFVTFCWNAPPHGDLENFFIVQSRVVMTCFPSVPNFIAISRKNIEILEGEQCAPPPWDLIWKLRMTDVYQRRPCWTLVAILFSDWKLDRLEIKTYFDWNMYQYLYLGSSLNAT